MDDPAPFISIVIIISMITTDIVHASGSISTSTIHNQKYRDCNETYQCGGFNITYPFYSSDRPQYCGYPGFELGYCNYDHVHPNITINKHTYIVFNISLGGSSNILTVARDDWYAPTDSDPITSSKIGVNQCPWSSSVNATLDFTHFSYTSNDGNITFYYGCGDDDEASAPKALIPHTCGITDGSVSGYFVTNKFESEHTFQDFLSMCKGGIFIPALRHDIELIQNSLEIEKVFTALNHGFELRWIAENDKCLACLRSGGMCGSSDQNDESNTSSFLCHCVDDSYVDKCPTADTDARSSTSRNIVIGVSVGAAAIAALILLCAYLFFQQRKKKRLQASNVAAGKNKDINSTTATAAYTFNSRGILQSSNGTPQSSNGYTTTPTTNSQSTSSYVSSKSDVERGGKDDSSYFGVRVFSYEELEQATSHFDEARELGDGGFGTVYYGKLPDGCLVAVKRLYENSFKRVEQFMNEVQILARLRHKNLVTLYGCTSRRSRELLLVYEYISNGTVADHIHGRLASSDSSKNNNNQHHLPWLTRLNIAVETAEALAFLHASDVIHRDVKTTNILLDQNFCVKVADFGLSRLFPTDVTHVSTAPQGTPGYVDPEYYQCYRLTEKSDVYSFGVVLIELISSKQAVDITRHRHHINLSNMAVDKIQNQQLNELVDPNLGFENDCIVGRMVKGVAELAFRCLQQERDIRPTMGEVLDTLRLIQKYAVDQDHKVLQEVIVVDKSSIVCKEDEDVELLKNVPPPFSPEDLKMGVKPSS